MMQIDFIFLKTEHFMMHMDIISMSRVLMLQVDIMIIVESTYHHIMKVMVLMIKSLMIITMN